jgi:hypothetical protein
VPDRVIYVEAGDEKLRHHRHRHPPLAAAGRGGRFWTADGLRHPLARQRPPSHPLAGAWCWPPEVAARIDPMPGRRKR